jgi:hypothetical protein
MRVIIIKFYDITIHIKIDNKKYAIKGVIKIDNIIPIITNKI